MSLHDTTSPESASPAWRGPAPATSTVGGRWLRPLLIFAALLGTGLWNLAGPAPWWDEGWTLSVARNLVERGHYGRLLAGEPAPNGLEASYAVTGPVALTMQVLGVGLWQGRVFGVVCGVGALALLFALAARLYDRRAAWGGLFALLMLSMHPQLNPLIQGRQVLGELPMLLLGLGGYLCLLAALRGSPAWLGPAAALWGLASVAKAQFEPFWAVSILAALALAAVLRRWRDALLLAVGVAMVYAVQLPIGWLVDAARDGRTLPGEPVSGVVEVVALVTQPSNRLFALRVLLLFGLPTLAALAWAAWRTWRERQALAADPAALTVRVALLALAGSWAGWFALLSVGVPRYLFPATFVGAIFLGALLRDLTGGLRLGLTLEAMARGLRGKREAGGGRREAGRERDADQRPPHPSSRSAWLAALIVAAALPLTLLAYGRYYFEDDRSAQRVAEYLNTRTPPDALVETYESELHFFLERPYHYPPDQTHVELNRRSLLGRDVPVSYDPLAADPDYLVIGRFARGNRLYQPAVESGAFRLLFRDGLYDVYERAR